MGEVGGPPQEEHMNCWPSNKHTHSNITWTEWAIFRNTYMRTITINERKDYGPEGERRRVHGRIWRETRKDTNVIIIL